MNDRRLLGALLGGGVLAGAIAVWLVWGLAREDDTEFEVQWAVVSYDPDRLADVLGGGHPERADAMTEVLAWDQPHRREELSWLGERIATQGVGYDGLSEARAREMDLWMMAAPSTEGLADAIGGRPCGWLSREVLERAAGGLSAEPSSALLALQDGRRVGGGSPSREPDGTINAYAVLSPAETQALVAELEEGWSAIEDPAIEDEELLGCLREAAETGRGATFTNDD